MKNFFLALLLTVPLSAQAQFPDVPADHKHADAIAFVQAEGIVNGYPDGSFQPNASINRAEFTKIVIESAFTADEIAACNVASIGLSDVAADVWFAPYVCVAKANGVIGGYPDGTFQGANNVNYAESAKIITETFDLPLGAAGGEWYTPYVGAILAADAVPERYIASDASISRGQMAHMIYAIQGKKVMDDTMMDDTHMSSQSGYMEYTPEKYAELRANNTPFVLNLSASWCPNCKALDAQLENNIAALPDNAIILKADYDAETALRQEFGVTVQTSGVFFDADGQSQTLNGQLTYDAVDMFFQSVGVVGSGQTATLSPVGDYVATGTAAASFNGSEYMVSASFADLPDAPDDFFYEGWIVRKSPLSVLSTGEATKQNGVYMNTWTDTVDRTDHGQYVLTIEPNDGDPAPAEHVTEGPFM